MCDLEKIGKSSLINKYWRSLNEYIEHVDIVVFNYVQHQPKFHLICTCTFIGNAVWRYFISTNSLKLYDRLSYIIINIKVDTPTLLSLLIFSEILTFFLWSLWVILSVSMNWLWYWKLLVSLTSNTLWRYQ